VQRAFAVLLQAAQEQRAVVQYKVLRRDFFVIMTYKDGESRCLRYHADGNGVLGFTFRWTEANGQVYGERLVTLISASLCSGDWRAMGYSALVQLRGRRASATDKIASARTTSHVAAENGR
jgi:hypothetical protein